MPANTVEGTFYFNFCFTNFHENPPTKSQLENELKAHTKYHNVIPTFSELGQENGYLWILILRCPKGKETNILCNMTNIAIKSASRLGGLIVQGPRCNSNWRLVK